MIDVLVIVAWVLAVCASCAALSRWEAKRARQRLTTPEKWALLVRGSSRWK